MKRLFPSSFYNVITLIGAAIVGISLMLILFLLALEAMEIISAIANNAKIIAAATNGSLNILINYFLLGCILLTLPATLN